MALPATDRSPSCLVFSPSLPQKNILELWGSSTNVESSLKEFCQSLVLSSPPDLCVLYTENVSLVEFVRLVLANGPHVVCVCSNANFCRRFEDEAVRCASFVLVPEESPDVVPEAVTTALYHLSYIPDRIAKLISQERLLYQPINEIPFVPSYPLMPPESPIVDIKHLGSWSFNASKCENIVQSIFNILEAVMALPGLEEFRLSRAELWWFLCVVRACYCSHVSYHTFSHVCDVIQASFALMCGPVGVLKAHADGIELREGNKPGFGSKEVLAIILTALGHDLLHPGILAPLIIKESHYFSARFQTLEDYHRTFYMAILRQLWQSAANDPLITEIIQKGIAATNLADHAKYAACDDSYCHIVKIADISNGAREDPDFIEECAERIYQEVDLSRVIARELRVSLPIFDLFDSDMPYALKLRQFQLSFLHRLLLPYLISLNGKLGDFSAICTRCTETYEFWRDHSSRDHDNKST